MLSNHVIVKKNSLLFLGLFLALNSFGQTIKTINTDVFSVIYSEPYQQPLRVNYWVQCPTGDADRTGMDFYEVKGVITSDDNDYKNNVWDKGHMAPAADFVCDGATLRKTFSYLNCAHQNQYLNRGVWKILEGQEREWSKIDIVIVKIKLIFKENTLILCKLGIVIKMSYKCHTIITILLI